MSPKTKLGRNPFNKKPAAAPKRKKKKPSIEAQVRKANSTKRKRIPDDLDALWHELTHYWVPRVKACVYVRVIKLVSRFST